MSMIAVNKENDGKFGSSSTIIFPSNISYIKMCMSGEKKSSPHSNVNFFYNSEATWMGAEGDFLHLLSFAVFFNSISSCLAYDATLTTMTIYLRWGRIWFSELWKSRRERVEWERRDWSRMKMNKELPCCTAYRMMLKDSYPLEPNIRLNASTNFSITFFFRLQIIFFLNMTWEVASYFFIFLMYIYSSEQRHSVKKEWRRRQRNE